MKLATVILGLVSLSACTGSFFGSRSQAARPESFEFEPEARDRLTPFFKAANISYPPQKVFAVFFKVDREILLFAAGSDGILRPVRRMLIYVTANAIGPKLESNDHNFPEGEYRLKSFGLMEARFQAYLELAYPSEWDLEMAKRDGRQLPAKTVRIHGGGAVADSDMAIGRDGIEELVTLAKDTGVEKWQILVAPVDFRRKQISASELAKSPPWVAILYDRIRAAVEKLPK